MHSKLLKSTSEEFWAIWGRTSPPDNNQKDYNCPLPAPPTKRGGSKSAGRKKPKKKPQQADFII